MTSGSGNNDGADGLFSLMSSRALMRTFRPDPVPDEMVERLELAATMGARVGNPAHQHVIFVTDETVVRELQSALCKGLNRVNFWVKSAPLLAVALTKKTVVSRLRSLDAEKFDLVQAFERMALVAQAEGLGTCPVLGFDGGLVQSSVSAPPGWKAVAVLAAGYPGLSGEEILGINVISDFNEYYHRLRERLDRRPPESVRKMVSRDRFRGGRR